MRYARALFVFSTVLGAPSAAFALASAANVSTNNLEGVIAIIISLFNTAIPIGVAAALLGFLWGLMTLIWNAGNDKKRQEGKHVMIWGIVGLFIILSIVGIIAILQQTFGLQNTPIQIPSANPCQYGIDTGGNCASTPNTGTSINGLPPSTPLNGSGIPGTSPTLAP